MPLARIASSFTRGARRRLVESVLGRDVVSAIADAPGVRRAADGTPYLAASAFVSVDAIRRNGKRGSVLLVGVTPGAALVEPDLRILEGRSYRPAVHELIVSDSIRRIFRGLEVGSRITVARRRVAGRRRFREPRLAQRQRTARGRGDCHVRLRAQRVSAGRRAARIAGGLPCIR